MRKLPIGISDFKTIIDGKYYYADKTLFMKELMDSGAQVLLLPRPRRFGKTLNISMLKYFFEKVEKSNAPLFRSLKIEKEETFTEHQGKYPVIFLSFKDVKTASFEQALNHMQQLISAEF